MELDFESMLEDVMQATPSKNGRIIIIELPPELTDEITKKEKKSEKDLDPYGFLNAKTSIGGGGGGSGGSGDAILMDNPSQ